MFIPSKQFGSYADYGGRGRRAPSPVLYDNKKKQKNPTLPVPGKKPIPYGFFKRGFS
jgi:hypothetical protein